MMEEKIEVTSEISITIKVIGGKWKPLILEYLKENGARRYSEILRYLEADWSSTNNRSSGK